MRCLNCMEEIADIRPCPHCGYPAGTEYENKHYLVPGTKLADIYTVGTVIGAGGFGVTYIGWDESLNRKVAIKEYFPSSLSTRIPGQTAISAFSGEKQQIFLHGKERFSEEASLLRNFTGEEGIVSVYNVLEANGTVYIVMEYVEGITLKHNLEKFGTIPEHQLRNFMIPMLLSLKCVHNAGFIHRDISPDNIICQPDGSIKLVDFGSARYSVMEASKSLSVIIKQGFSPIEQYQSHGKQGPQTDLYAVGATMYKALTGITPDASIERISKDTLKKPSQCGVKVSEETENAIMAALNVRAEYRPQDIDTFLDILTGKRKFKKQVSLKKKLIFACIAALILGLGLGLLGWSLYRSSWTPSWIDTHIEVPDAINKTDTDAEILFTEHDLSMKVTGGRLYDAEMIELGYVAENLVVEQAPTAGTPVDPASTVGVILSKGKAKEYVPSVTDRLTEAALHEFEMSGFGETFEIELKEEYSDTNMVGTVISQSLPEDSPVDFDGKITLTVSLGRKDPLDSVSVITIEDYTGKDFNDLKRELLKNDIYLVKSASIYSTEYPYGTVISQSPGVGSEISSGGAVYVITSLGQELARVPDVRYLNIEDAKTALMESGLSWKIRYVVDPEVSYGLVAAQETEPGIKTPFGTEIELLVSAEMEGTETREIIDISLTPEKLELAENDTSSLVCSYTGEKDIVWSTSNNYIAQVADDGTVTAKNFGAVTISAAVDGNIAISTVTVTDETVLTEVDDFVMEVGDTVSLSSRIPEDILADVVWRSSSPSVATVDSKGTVTAVGEGYTSICASYKDQTIECGIMVNEKIEYIKIPQEALLGKLDTAKQALTSNEIRFDILDEYSDTVEQGNVIEVKYSGYIDNDCFYITENTDVTLRHSLGKNTVQSIAIKTLPSKTTYYIGETPNYAGMVITAKYKDGTTKDISKGYSASSAALTALGTQKITVTYENQSTSITVTVNPIAVTSLSVTPASLSCKVGETKTLSVSVNPGNATDKTVTVTSSNPAVVKADGLKLTAVNAGSSTITVKSINGKTATCHVKVTREATLAIKSLPAKTQYYRGDTFQEKGLVLRYTDKNGTEADFTNGYKLSYNMYREGKQTVNVTFQGLSTSFDITIKVPSITLTKTMVQDRLVLSVTTDPQNAKFSWSTSDPQILRIENGTLVPVSSGTALVQVQMEYNGLVYSDSVPVTVNTQSTGVPETNYSFAIDCSSAGNSEWMFNIKTDIPTFDLSKVKWSVVGTQQCWFDTSRRLYARAYNTFTANASYEYNGKTYTDSHTVKIQTSDVLTGGEPQEYSFVIEGDISDFPYYIFWIKTNIPLFDFSKVEWSVEGGEYLGIDEYNGNTVVDIKRDFSRGEVDNTPLTVTATYRYDGEVYTCTLELGGT